MWFYVFLQILGFRIWQAECPSQIPPKWSISNGIYEVKQNYDIVAKYTPNVYEIVVVTQYGTKATQLITYGEDINQEESDEIQAYIESNFEVECEIINGGQPVYSYLIGLE